MSFLIYDLTFLAIFIIIVAYFLYTHKKNLKREGLMYLYRTQLGVTKMDNFAKKYEKILRPLQYVIVALGYVLMLLIIILALTVVYTYFKIPTDSPISKVPAVLPLFPYFTDVFGLDSYFPSLTVIYFLIVILIVATVHEFSHGIFMRLHKLRIKSTGFAFLGPLLGAFVEQDDRELKKLKKFPQMAILAAGVFANIITALFFILLITLFFHAFFVPAGVNLINLYPTDIISTSAVLAAYPNITSNQNDLLTINLNNTIYHISPKVVNESLRLNLNTTWAYSDSPAYDNQILGNAPLDDDAIGIKGALTKINGIEIKSREDVLSAFNKIKPYEKVNITVMESDKVIISPLKPFYIGEEKTYQLTTADRNGSAFIGIFLAPETEQSKLARATLLMHYSPVQNLSTYYESKLGDFGFFIFYLFWWIIMINVLVAIFNMLPAGIFDGGRFFYLTILAITGNNKKKADKASLWMGKIFWFILILILAKWVFNLFF